MKDLQEQAARKDGSSGDEEEGNGGKPTVDTEEGRSETVSKDGEEVKEKE